MTVLIFVKSKGTLTSKVHRHRERGSPESPSLNSLNLLLEERGKRAKVKHTIGVRPITHASPHAGQAHYFEEGGGYTRVDLIGSFARVTLFDKSGKSRCGATVSGN